MDSNKPKDSIGYINESDDLISVHPPENEEEKLPEPSKEHKDVYTKTCNMVLTYPIDDVLDLNHITLHLRDKGLQNNIRSFPGLVWRVCYSKKIVGLIFKNSLVCTGSDCRYKAQYVINIMIEALRELGYNIIPSSTPTCHNIVVAAYLIGQEIDLDALNASYPLLCAYEELLFPGLVLKHNGLKHPTTAIIYGPGKFILVGGKDEIGTHTSAYQVYEFIEKFRLKKKPGELSLSEKKSLQKKRQRAEVNSNIKHKSKKRGRPKKNDTNRNEII